MKIICLLFVLVFVFIRQTNSQESKFNIDTISIYSIIDNEFSKIMDSVIYDFNSDYRYEKYKNSFNVIIHITLMKNDGDTYVSIKVNKNNNSQEPFVIFENPYLYQAYISYDSLFILTKIMFYDDKNDFKRLEKYFENIRKVPVVVKEAPLDYYQVSYFGEIAYEEKILSWLIDYSNFKIVEITKFYFNYED